jgi:iron-sulfur cluster repair protein YtfE (RIC family)
MYDYYDKYIEAGQHNDKDAQERWSRQLIWEIARHAVGEEIVVYPLMEKYLGQRGLELADEDRAQHQTAKENLYKLESFTPGSPEYDQLLKRVMDELHVHNDSEEQKDLPLLERALGDGESQAAAQSFTRTKKFVPTRYVTICASN